MSATKLNVWVSGYCPSNGTEGDQFQANWCDRCTRDHDIHGVGDGVGQGCPILMEALTGAPKGPPEWQRRFVGDSREESEVETRCSAFIECKETGCGPPPNPYEEGPMGEWNPKPVVHVEGQMQLAGLPLADPVKQPKQ